MKISSIDVSGVGGITELSVDFDPQFNIICGPNGVGKTTLLECISHSFISTNTRVLHRNVNSLVGKVNTRGEHKGVEFNYEFELSEYHPQKQQSISTQGYQQSSFIIPIKINRTFSYQQLGAISRDQEKNQGNVGQEAISGINFGDIKSWMANRYLFSFSDSLSSAQSRNLQVAKSAFSLFRPDVKFKEIDASTFDIILETNEGDIHYEYLSAGFKSTLSMILGIIKEVELRFGSMGIAVDEFEGVIIIDELELHLHPTWQTQVTGALKKVFPCAQFITTTHSPHIVQSAAPNEIITLKQNGKRVVNEQVSTGEYGYAGWTVEEILIDVMGMKSTRNEIYKHKLDTFLSALDNHNADLAEKSLRNLEAMLHPNNPTRKLLRLELASEIALND